MKDGERKIVDDDDDDDDVDNEIFVVEHSISNGGTVSKNVDTSTKKSHQEDGDQHNDEQTSTTRQHHEPHVLRSGSVLVRGRFRRVWRERFIELTKEGILKYYSTTTGGTNGGGDHHPSRIMTNQTMLSPNKGGGAVQSTNNTTSTVTNKRPTNMSCEPPTKTMEDSSSNSNELGPTSSTVGSEWCDVLQSCYPGGDSSSTTKRQTEEPFCPETLSDDEDETPSSSASSSTTRPQRKEERQQPKHQQPQEQDDKNTPRAVLLVLRARLLDPSTFKDGRSGLPLNKWGFLFHGHILYYEDHLLTGGGSSGGSGSNSHDAARISESTDIEHGVLEAGQANSSMVVGGNVVLHNPFSSRAFHVAVDTQQDAIEWVRALQSVALATTCGLNSEMPPRYAILDENSVTNKDVSRSSTSKKQNENKAQKDREKWATSLFDPLKLSISSQDLQEKEEEEEKMKCSTSSQCKSNNSQVDTRPTKESNNATNDVNGHQPLLPNETGCSNHRSVFHRMMRFGLDAMSGSVQKANRLLDVFQEKCHLSDRCTYWCVLGLAVSFSSYLGAILVERCTSSNRFFPQTVGGGPPSNLLVPSTPGSSSSGSTAGGPRWANLLPPTTMQMRIDHAALGLAFAFACGYKLGSTSNAGAEVASTSTEGVRAKHNSSTGVDSRDDTTTSTTTTVMEDEQHLRTVTSASTNHCKETMNEVLSSPLPKYPSNGGSSCWSEPSCSLFKVRGQSYLKDRKKVPSHPAIFKCQGVDVWLTDEPRSNIARHPAVQGGKLSRKLKNSTGGYEEGIFVLNFLLPFGNFVAVFDVPSVDSMPKHVQKVWKNFCAGDQSYRDARLKLLPIVVDGPWVVKTVVGNGSSPALLGKAVPLQYHFTSPKQHNDGTSTDNHPMGVYEVDVIISASNIARGILNVVKGHTKYLTIAFALIIEATDETELPENILCTFGVHSVDLDKCPSLDDFEEDSMRDEN